MIKPLESLKAINTFLGTALAIVIVGLLSLGGWYGYNTLNAERLEREKKERELEDKQVEIAKLNEDLTARDQRIGKLNGEIDVLNKDIEAKEEEIRQKAAEIRRLDTAIRLLKIDRRVARVDVLSQTGSARQRNLQTEFRFVELDDKGKAIEKPRTFSIEGDLLYVDAWVVKFSDELVEAGDPLRGASIYVFRRLFGETMQPKEGFVLDEVGSQPAAYRTGDDVSDFERQIWTRFWEYANNPTIAKEAGIRAAHGEAPSIKLRPNTSYTVRLRASDGLTIKAESSKSPPKKSSDAM